MGTTAQQRHRGRDLPGAFRKLQLAQPDQKIDWREEGTERGEVGR